MTTTPWGAAQQQKLIAQGIVRYDTASHGGYHLDEARLNAMPDALRSIEPWAGEGWYEEDCDWAIVVLAFPQHFSDYHVFSAVRLVQRHYPKYMQAARDWLSNDPKGTNVRDRADLYQRQHGHEYQCAGMSTGGNGWHVSAVRLDGAERISFKISNEGINKLATPFSLEAVHIAGGKILQREAA